MSARTARWLLCASALCFAAAQAPAAAQTRFEAGGSRASAFDALQLAQLDDQPADSQTEAPEAPRAPKPAPKPAAKPEPKPEPKPAAKAPPPAQKKGKQPKQPASEAEPSAAQPGTEAKPATPPPPTPPPASAAEPQPITHAAQAGVKLCLDGLVRAANATIDTQHTAMSEWSNGAADSHVFESIVSLAYPNKVAPRAIVALIGAPTRNQGCDTSYVQVFPTSRDCSAIQGDLLKDGKVIANLSGVAVTQSSVGARQLLLPTPGNGCVIVVIGLTFGK